VQQQVLAGRVGAQIAALALEQRAAHVLFQPLDLHADGGLAAPHPRRRQLDAAAVDHRDEAAQKRKVQGAGHGSDFLKCSVNSIRLNEALPSPKMAQGMRGGRCDTEPAW
jgi:hypothetical protein